jgi:hypothetical protein
MIWSLSLKARLMVIGGLVLGIVLVTGAIVHTIHKQGYEAALRAVEKENADAVKSATDERKRRERECARDPAVCLSDAWTRDE